MSTVAKKTGKTKGRGTRKAEPRKPGRPAIPVEELIRRGTYRPDRQGPRRVLAPLLEKPARTPKAQCGDPFRWVQGPADEFAITQGCYFDEALAAYVVEWFRRYLRHSKGLWAGKPFELLDWQRDEVIYPLFGWMNVEGLRRFRESYVEVSKKNGKSTLASGIGCYMLLGDGEAGAEVYSLASDKDQASIVHGEAINMIEASPDLADRCKINRTTRTIVYEKSKYSARASNASGSEGWNGNCGIKDELHIWRGRVLWDATKYMGRARAEPLSFAISTAGEDLTTVCYEQHERAVRVIAGDDLKPGDERFHARIWAADPADDFDDPATWKKANPSLGGTIKESDFAADVAEAKRSSTTWNAMLRYSFNIWCTAETPWLEREQWDRCGDEFTAESLKGRECWGGLDLAKSRDLTALVLMFREEDSFRQLAYFFMPEDVAHQRRNIAPYEQWIRNGWLTVTPGNVCDYAFVKAKLAELNEQFEIQELAFDPYNAEHLTQEVENELGIPRIEFRQTILNFASPTAEYERLVIDGKLRHNNNPLLTWQSRHVCVKADENRNLRPVKRKHGDHRTIDGIVAGIMALSRAIQANDTSSFYDTNPLEMG